MSDASAVTAAGDAGDEACRGTPPKPNVADDDSTAEAEDASCNTRK